MSDPRDTDPRYADLKRRLDEAPSGGGSMWPWWLAALVAILVIVGVAIGYNQTEQASNNQSNAPTTTGAAPSAPRLAPPANPGGDASRPTPAMPTPVTPAPAPTPNEGPR
jgi:hypothetical protein